MMVISNVPVRGSSGNDVMVVQKALEARGFSPGAIDGLFGPGVARAVSAFQKKNGLEGSGELGPKTLNLLGIDVIPSSPVQGQAITRPFPRVHSSRHLHPTLRLLMESKIFPGGKIPLSFTNRQIPQMVIACARGLAALGIKESDGKNHGTVVGYIQSIIGEYRAGGNGDSWCMSTDGCIVAFIEDYLHIESPFPSSEGCVEVWRQASHIQGLTTQECEPGSFFVGKHLKDPTKGHTGAVLADEGKGIMETFEGNRSNAAYIGTRAKDQTGDLKTLGYVRVFPNNKV